MASRRRLHLWPEGPRREGDSLEVKARLEFEGSAPESLWFRLPASHEPSLTLSANPLVIGTLFLAMRRATELRVHARVSPSLLRNLDEFQAAWSCWHPGVLRRVDITSDDEREDEPGGVGESILTFSGGLDSCFTAWRHTRGHCGRGRYSLRAVLMVHGFDIPLDRPDFFRAAADNSRALAESLGLEFIPLATNFRQLGGDWEQEHGAALAACLHLLAGRFSSGLIAGSHVYTALRFPWGSNPLTDPLLSSAGFPIVYDGADATRREKAREVAHWAEAMQRLRCCWEGERKDRNCGACLRCVGTAICFAVEGQRLPASLPLPSLEHAIRRLAPTRMSPVSVTRLEELAQAARAAKIREPWVDALEDCIRQQRGPGAGRFPILRRLLHLPRRPAVPANDTPSDAAPLS